MSKHYSETTIAMKVLTVGIVQLFFSFIKSNRHAKSEQLVFYCYFGSIRLDTRRKRKTDRLSVGVFLTMRSTMA